MTSPRSVTHTGWNQSENHHGRRPWSALGPLPPTILTEPRARLGSFSGKCFHCCGRRGSRAGRGEGKGCQWGSAQNCTVCTVWAWLVAPLHLRHHQQARPPPQSSLRPPGRSLSLGRWTEVLKGFPGPSRVSLAFSGPQEVSETEESGKQLRVRV